MTKIGLGSEKGGRIVVIGLGSVARTVLPLFSQALSDAWKDIVVIADDDSWAQSMNDRVGCKFIHIELTVDNFVSTLDGVTKTGDFVINLATNVNSYDLIAYCLSRGISYLDTSNERWRAESDTPSTTLTRRRDLLERASRLPKRATAVIGHGANPGLVSHFVKQALLELAGRAKIRFLPEQANRVEWAELLRTMGIAAIHVNERDTQVPKHGRGPSELVNTWSVDGLLEEAAEPASFGWGTIEGWGPNVVRCGSLTAVYFQESGASVKVRSWLPSCTEFLGLVIPHPETFSIAEWFTSRDRMEFFQPTVLFAYQPCDAAIASLHCAEYLGPNAKRRVVGEI